MPNGLQPQAGTPWRMGGWHSFPSPDGWSPDRVPVMGTIRHGRLTGGNRLTGGDDALHAWMFDDVRQGPP